jgi:hypothetical protein
VVINLEVVRLENEVVIFGIVFGIVQGQSYDKNCFWNCHSTRNEYLHERGYFVLSSDLSENVCVLLSYLMWKKGSKTWYQAISIHLEPLLLLLKFAKTLGT